MLDASSSLTYLTYSLIGTGGMWLASRIVRHKVATSPRSRSLLAVSPMFFPLVLLVWIRPDLSALNIRAERLAWLLGRQINISFHPTAYLNAWTLLNFIRFEIRLFALIAEFSGILLVLGMGAATALVALLQILGKKVVQRTRGTIPIGEGEIPELDRIVKRLAEKAGIPIPRVFLVEDLRPQAFATGSGSSTCLTFSTGLLMTADQEELDAVTAHEIAHLKGRDNHIHLLVNWLRIASFYNPFVLIAAGEVTREREFAADRGAMQLLGEGESLVKGLNMASGRRSAPGGGIVASFSDLAYSSTFTSHHPSPEERMKAASGTTPEPRNLKRMVWTSAAMMVVLFSILAPAGIAESLQRISMLPPFYGQLQLAHPNGLTILESGLESPTEMPERLAAIRTKIATAHPEARPALFSGTRERANRSEGPSPFKAPAGMRKSSRFSRFSPPEGKLRAGLLSTIMLRNIFKFSYP